jgi:hypothetical protein
MPFSRKINFLREPLFTKNTILKTFPLQFLLYFLYSPLVRVFTNCEKCKLKMENSAV